MGYTKRETEIVNGVISIDNVSNPKTLKRIYDKAVKANDTDIVLKVLTRIEYLKKVAESGYTEKQYKVITGEIKNVTGKLASMLLQAASERNDNEVISLALSYVSISKERRRAKAIERNRIRHQKVLKGDVIEWREPKNNEYTDKQKKVVRGEIPLNQVHTNMLVRIYQKAKNNGDIELSEHILSIIIDRRTMDKEHRMRGIQELKALRDRGGSSLNHLTQWEKSVLEGDTEDTTIEELEHILAVCKHIGRNDDVIFCSTLIWYRKHPKELYRAEDAQEAIDKIEHMTRIPIRRPQSWFN